KKTGPRGKGGAAAPKGGPKSRAGSRTKPRTRAKAAKAPAAAAGPAVLVVNMIPRSLSRETNQDSEPSLSVNPANPLQIVGTAFTPDPMGGDHAPIFVSTDGGNTWVLNAIIPSAVGNSSTHDVSLAFASSSGVLYGGILRDPSINFETLRAKDFTAPDEMEVIGSRPDNDQPCTFALTTGGRDRGYIGNHDFQAGNPTATGDGSLNPPPHPPSLTHSPLHPPPPPRPP